MDCRSWLMKLPLKERGHSTVPVMNCNVLHIESAGGNAFRPFDLVGSAAIGWMTFFSSPSARPSLRPTSLDGGSSVFLVLDDLTIS
jgi:hypothetical protein